jgi:hypothetical protein
MKRVSLFASASFIVGILMVIAPAHAEEQKPKPKPGLMSAKGKHIPEVSITLRDASSGQATGKRQHQLYKMQEPNNSSARMHAVKGEHIKDGIITTRTTTQSPTGNTMTTTGANTAKGGMQR